MILAVTPADIPSLVLAASGIFVLVAIVRRSRSGRPLLHVVERPFRPVPPSTLLCVAAGLFLVTQSAQLVGLKIGGASGAAVRIAVPLVVSVLAGLLARRDVLLPRGSLAHRVGMGLLFLWAAFPLIYGTYVVCRLFGPEQAPVEEIRARAEGWQGLVLVAVLVAPVAEEICFRGLLYPALRQRFRALPAILLTSIAFALVHLPPTTWLPLTILAVVLGWLVETTGSVVPCIAAHMAFNGLTVATLLLL